MFRSSVILLLAAITPVSLARATEWVVDPGQSAIEFRYSQSGSEMAGRFDEFNATIDFDPTDLVNARISAEISIGSFNSGNAQIDSAVAGADWFNLAEFPKAEFMSTSVTVAQSGNYAIEGNLTIRGLSMPVTLTGPITIDGNAAFAVVSTQLQRTDFGVGQGDFASDKQVGHEVPVTITIHALVKD